MISHGVLLFLSNKSLHLTDHCITRCTVENWRESIWGGTSPVGTYSPQGDSLFGCADMSGNLWEWTSSLWGKELGASDYGYPYKPRDGRENQRANEDILRILRGGLFYNASRFLRAAVRVSSDSVYNYFGFRVVLAPNSLKFLFFLYKKTPSFFKKLGVFFIVLAIYLSGDLM